MTALQKGAGGGSGPPLRIALVSNYLPSGSKIGVGYWVDQFARELSNRGHEVTIFSSCRAVEDAPYKTKTIELAGRFRTFRFAEQIRRLDLSTYDVLHAHGDDYLCWRQRLPAHIRTMHGSCFSEALRIQGAWERLRMAALGCTELVSTIVADRTFVISPATRKWMPWVRDVLPDGVDLARFTRPATSVREDVPTILFVGTYRQRKRGALLVDIFKRQIRPILPDAQLWMVAEDCPPSEGVIPLGRLTNEELVDRYHRAWTFCLPSSYEGLGIPYIEALAAGLPVVAAPNPGARFVLDGGRSGVLCQDGELGAALLRLLRDRGERDHLSHLGVERALRFSLADVTSRYEEVYYQLIQQKRDHG